MLRLRRERRRLERRTYNHVRAMSPLQASLAASRSGFPAGDLQQALTPNRDALTPSTWRPRAQSTGDPTLTNPAGAELVVVLDCGDDVEEVRGCACGNVTTCTASTHRAAYAPSRSRVPSHVALRACCVLAVCLLCACAGICVWLARTHRRKSHHKTRKQGSETKRSAWSIAWLDFGRRLRHKIVVTRCVWGVVLCCVVLCCVVLSVFVLCIVVVVLCFLLLGADA